LAIVCYYVFRREAMGGGDIKLAAAIGANITLGAAMLSFLVAVFIGSIIGIGLIAFGKKSRKDYVPFGPMMVAGAFVAVFYGTDLLRLLENYIYTAYP
ncbi:MAG: prepilin peptidase, partial [Armatimonadota bacterium]